MDAGARVTILQRRLVQYRVGMFERLRHACAEEGIELRVVYGQASPEDAKRRDAGRLEWGDEVRSRWRQVGDVELLWQPCPREARDTDLIVLTQESRILSNYPILARRGLSILTRPNGKRRQVAYWGHGRNLQSFRPDGLREKWKQLLLTRVDWWFAYNNHTRDLLTQQGFPAARISSLENAIDNDAFVADLAAVPDELLDQCRRQVDLAQGAHLGLYCGALYGDKRVDQLVEVADHLHRADPEFRLVVVGDGPTRPELERLAQGKPWIHTVGAQFGVDKAAWFRLASVQISPGTVGLHILDSFASGVPMFTVASAQHGPEIDYLDHGRNGVMLADDDPALLAEAVLDVLDRPDRLQAMAEAGRADADHYTVDNMVANFVAGITACLS